MQSISQGILRLFIITVCCVAYLLTINTLEELVYYLIEQSSVVGEQSWRYLGVFVLWAIPLLGLAACGIHAAIETLRSIRSEGMIEKSKNIKTV